MNRNMHLDMIINGFQKESVSDISFCPFGKVNFSSINAEIFGAVHANLLKKQDIYFALPYKNCRRCRFFGAATFKIVEGVNFSERIKVGGHCSKGPIKISCDAMLASARRSHVVVTIQNALFLIKYLQI